MFDVDMKKTSIYLEPELDAALSRMADRQGITKAELIRRSLRAATEGDPRPRLAAIGIGQGPVDVSADVDKHLAESGFAES